MDLTGPGGLLVFSVLAAHAETEVENLSDRVTDGMAAGKADGYKYGSTLIKGHPWISKKNKHKVKDIKDLHKLGRSINHIRRVVHMSEVAIKWIIATDECDIHTRKELSRRLQLPSQRRPRG